MFPQPPNTREKTLSLRQLPLMREHPQSTILHKLSFLSFCKILFQFSWVSNISMPKANIFSQRIPLHFIFILKLWTCYKISKHRPNRKQTVQLHQNANYKTFTHLILMAIHFLDYPRKSSHLNDYSSHLNDPWCRNGNY